MCLGLPYNLMGPRVSWEVRNKAVPKDGPPCPQLSTALPGLPTSSQAGGEGLEVGNP